ncbi:hypothetical protein BDR04DRAFT_1164690 [Suillus decipiens]|nr:hypothetical protein BDR04DRAFT_1164690 [Suillus decipiens]
MHVHSAKSMVAVFNALASETWIDIAHVEKCGMQMHWISKSGILDIFLLPGPMPTDVFIQYAHLQALHPSQPTGHLDIISKRFDEEDFPVDVFWLDIKYAEDHRYFMWNKKTFPDLVEMMKDVEAVEQKMVIIINPHLKCTNNCPVYKCASELGILVKPKSSEGEYKGWCWPSSSSWIDFFHPASWNFWIQDKDYW